jgi:2,3-bisphosphoglycerate-independent phosphoglycerate mutase
MTEYQEGLPVSAIAFPRVIVTDTLSEVISKKGLLQMHMSESEKERFVTYYFNGQKETKFPGEDVRIVPSPQVATYDLEPEMSVHQLASEFSKAVKLGKYSFFVINCANADMLAHTGNIKATSIGVEHLDQAVGEMVNSVLTVGGTVVITADHGNAEEMLTYPSTSFFITTEKGKVSTDHSNNPVPFIVISGSLQGKTTKFRNGSLSDVAPTILHILNIPKPASMTGRSLFDKPST